jgi:hypothetical protein
MMQNLTSGEKAKTREPVTDVLPGDSSGPASPNTYVHHVKGRVRVQSAVLRGDVSGMEVLSQHLGAIRGVRKLACNPIIGSITVEYAPELELTVLLGAFREAGIGIAAFPTAQSRTTPAASSPWRNLFTAGLAAHLVLDVLAWGFAGAALMR